MRILFLLLLGLLPPANGAESPIPRPNVLFLICDDLNCDIGSFGHAKMRTPNMDRLAARGVRFGNAYCQYPLCGPSRASFMSGLYPDQTLIWRNAIYLREHVPNVQTLSQMFRRNGYIATRIGKIYHYGVPKNIGTSGHDDPYSWDYTFNPRGRDRNEEDKIFSLRPGNLGGTLSWLAAEGKDEEQTDGIAATIAVRLLKEYHQTKQPFFLAVGLFRPHTPFVAPKKYFDLYPPESIQIPRVPKNYLRTLPPPARQSLTRKKNQVHLEESLARQTIQAYHASISFADAQLGRVLDALDSTGLAGNTIVLFTSDHGYHMGEHGHWQKTTLFENATRVPLILAGPGIGSEGVTTQAPAEMVDFYPTLAELCGLPHSGHLSGISLVPALMDPEARPREAALTQYLNGYSLRTERFRYTEWGEKGSLGAELYDHSTDPEELENLANNDQFQKTRKELSGKLHRRIQSVRTAPPGVQQLRFENNRRVPSF